MRILEKFWLYILIVNIYYKARHSYIIHLVYMGHVCIDLYIYIDPWYKKICTQSMHICVHGHWGMFSLATRVLLIWVIQAPRILHPWWPARCSLALASTGSLVRLQTHKNAYKSALPSGWEHVLWSQTLGVQLLARPLTGYMILGSHVTSLSLICTMRIIIVFILNVLLQVNTYRRLEQCLAHDNLLYRCWYKNMKKMQSILLTKKKKQWKPKTLKKCHMHS